MKCKVPKRLCPASGVRPSHILHLWFVIFWVIFWLIFGIFFSLIFRLPLQFLRIGTEKIFQVFFVASYFSCDFRWDSYELMRFPFPCESCGDAISFPVQFLRWCDFLSRAVATAMRWTALRARILEQLPPHTANTAPAVFIKKVHNQDGFKWTPNLH